MITQDIFVGVVAVATGLFVLASAVSKSAWVDQFWLSRRLANSSNSGVSRVIVFAVGFTCALLGVLLLLGFFPSQRSNDSDAKLENRNRVAGKRATALWQDAANRFAAMG